MKNSYVALAMTVLTTSAYANTTIQCSGTDFTGNFSQESTLNFSDSSTGKNPNLSSISIVTTNRSQNPEIQKSIPFTLSEENTIHSYVDQNLSFSVDARDTTVDPFDFPVSRNSLLKLRISENLRELFGMILNESSVKDDVVLKIRVNVTGHSLKISHNPNELEKMKNTMVYSRTIEFTGKNLEGVETTAKGSHVIYSFDDVKCEL